MTHTTRTTRLRPLLVAGALALAAGSASATPPPIGTDAFAICSPEWVAAHRTDPGVIILDVRTSVADYQSGHVPGAVFLANDALRAPADGVPVQYLDAPEMAALFRRAGVDPGDTVVIYADGREILGATMVAYGLHRVGHRRTMIMDGGLAAWRDTFPLDQAYPTAPPGALSPAFDRTIGATTDEVAAALDDPGVVILDTRPAADYLGNTSRWMRNGHIPGARNLDWRRLMQDGNLHAFRPVAEMRTIVASTGVRPDDDVIVSCGTSREATLVFHVMRHVLGYPRVRLYEGSWTAWCARPDLPVERDPVLVPAAHALPATARLEPYECGSVKRMHTFGGLFLASQPSPADLRLAQQGGIRTVVNMRPASEMTDFDERALVTSLGMTYVNPGWNGPEQLTDALLDEVLGLLRTAERPLLLHCSSANRVGPVWIAYAMIDRGLGWEDALAEATTIGLRTPAYAPIARDYAERHLAAPSAAANGGTTGGLDVATRDALLEALHDERSAQAFYRAVIDRFGARRPFSNVVRAEGRHEAAVIALLERHGFAVPDDPFPHDAMDVPDTFAAACRAAVEAEERNIAMYERFLEVITDPEIREVMTSLRDASADRHLPAFRRHARPGDTR